MTQLLLTDLLLTARVPWPTIVYTVIADEVMIVCGLVGALVPSVYKWGYFAIATLALFYIMFNIAIIGMYLHPLQVSQIVRYSISDFPA
jgi:bacteriorhodopsin